LNLKDSYECFILIEPGLGYIIPVLQEKFNKSKIVALHADEGFPSNGIPSFYGNASCAQEFLETELADIDAGAIKIIEWRPSMNYYREDYIKLLSAAVEFIKRGDAGKRTAAAFGKKWVHNFFRNLRLVNISLLYKKSNFPVIVTGSGPGLEKTMPFLCETQKSCVIIASASSVLSLAHNGITADIVITADGGSWALTHVYSMFRNKYAAFLAANLCAALPSQCVNTSFLLLNDGSLWQNIIFHELSLPTVIIPQRGTVTASAVDLALLLSDGNIYLAGMDLGVSDIRTHVRPYGFDYIFSGSANRLSPLYAKNYFRSGQIRGGGSMDIYASWFNNQLSVWPKRIFSIGGSRVFFKEACPSEQTVKNRNMIFKAVNSNDDPSLFYKKGAEALCKALKNTEYSKDIKKELAPLLFPEKKEVTLRELEKAIEEAADV